MSDQTLFVYNDVGMRGNLSAAQRIQPGRLYEARARLLEICGNGQQGWMETVSNPNRLKEVKDAVQEFKKFKNCLVLGIGGSDLGARAILQALGKESKTKIWFSGNTTEPEEISRVLDQIPWKNCCINVISKSGGTLETMSVFFLAKDRLEKAVGKEKARKAIICTTDPDSGELRQLAQKNNWTCLPIPKNIGGRFSVLTAVGLFPLGLAGVSLEKLLDGAAQMRDSWIDNAGSSHESDRFAAWHAAHFNAGRYIHVLFSYTSRLSELANWWRQLWAESLGKTITGRVPFGPTPVVSIGPMDQHSQLQLYQDGPDDKAYTFLLADSNSKLRVPASLKSITSLEFAAGKNFNELLNAELEGTMETLAEKGRPIGKIQLGKIDEASIGALVMHYEIATAMAAQILGINAFDQPGVEAGKHKTKALLENKISQPEIL